MLAAGFPYGHDPLNSYTLSPRRTRFVE